MAEWAMPYVVQKGSGNSGLCSLLVRLTEFPRYYLDELTSGLENTDAVRQPRVGSAGKHELAKSKLLDPSQALKLRGVQQSPRKLVQAIVFPEDYQPVDRIADALRPWHIGTYHEQ